MTVAPMLCVAAVAFAPADDAAERPLAGAAAERAAEAALEATLDGPPPVPSEMSLGESFPEAVAVLGRFADVAVIVDRRAFGDADPAAVPFAPPTAETVQNRPTLRAAFQTLLDAAGGPPLVLENRAGLLRITAAGDAAGNLVPRVYDVRGLSESLGLTEADRTEGTVVQRIAGPGAGREPTRLDPPLILALKTGVGPGPGVAEWDTAGGPAAIAELGGRLVVRQSPAGHAALAHLLADLRATADAPAPGEPAE
ncbi:hypothetical protein [Alienimonas californiensis]|uniref:Uncharacterized protein n=1 Tax=Alienimonas californiensis TaxID=2527989 RepID=A0A517P828_9PLAN|nr:hypothetical protein [Alienimonas californiensis]QDT15530.1 hypothetical protein CA12_16150 [Alienimonas californiensis]